MSEIVERVKRAIIEADNTDGGREDGISYERMARAAIEVMRETTDEISGAGGAVIGREFDDDSRFPCVVAVMAWQAMIDAALAADTTSAG